MEWIDIACIVFTCVTANHLGLVSAIEKAAKHSLKIVNCVKCSSFWFVLIYMLVTTFDVILSLAISFLATYSAIWLELLEGYVDTLYLKIYEKIYHNPSNDALATNADNGDTASTVS